MWERSAVFKTLRDEKKYVEKEAASGEYDNAFVDYCEFERKGLWIVGNYIACRKKRGEIFCKGIENSNKTTISKIFKSWR